MVSGIREEMARRRRYIYTNGEQCREGNGERCEELFAISSGSVGSRWSMCVVFIMPFSASCRARISHMNTMQNAESRTPAQVNHKTRNSWIVFCFFFSVFFGSVSWLASMHSCRATAYVSPFIFCCFFFLLISRLFLFLRVCAATVSMLASSSVFIS